MPESTPEQLRFPPISGFSIRGDFQGGALSSDFGPMLLRGVDQHIGLIERLAGTIADRRHPAYKDRIKLHLLSSCAVKSLLSRVTEILFQAKPPVLDTS